LKEKDPSVGSVDDAPERLGQAAKRLQEPGEAGEVERRKAHAPDGGEHRLDLFGRGVGRSPSASQEHQQPTLLPARAGR